MSIEAEQLEDWIGSEVVDPEGAKLGKVAEVYYQGADPLIVEIKSGVIGRKLALAALGGATVSMKHLRLNQADTVATNGGSVDPEALAELAAHDARLTGLDAAQLESGSQRQARIAAAQAAVTHATALEADATHRAQEAEVAAKVAQEAAERSAAAQQAAATAAEQATAARAKADELQRAL